MRSCWRSSWIDTGQPLHDRPNSGRPRSGRRKRGLRGIAPLRVTAWIVIVLQRCQGASECLSFAFCNKDVKSKNRQ